ncbi:hypothetical protein VTL71DRAFT_1670 [Oculimacula yallundae]|uniref:Uncharacterized protein n=1 Tax=Oculimacula yallundae TaxID=86028 RepID=A0ABR4CD99_9HELO
MVHANCSRRCGGGKGRNGRCLQPQQRVERESSRAIGADWEREAQCWRKARTWEEETVACSDWRTGDKRSGGEGRGEKGEWRAVNIFPRSCCELEMENGRDETSELRWKSRALRDAVERSTVQGSPGQGSLTVLRDAESGHCRVASPACLAYNLAYSSSSF